MTCLKNAFALTHLMTDKLFFDPDSTPAAYPINQDRSSRGRNFAIVNARRTHEAIDELHDTSSEDSGEESVRTLLSKINTLQDIRYYLSHEVTHECSIETTEETCLKIESDESDVAFFGIYNVSFPYPDEPDRVYIQQLITEDICIFGTLMVMSSDSAESWHICDLDRMFYLFLERNTEYRLSFQWNSARTAKHVMFSLPLSGKQHKKKSNLLHGPLFFNDKSNQITETNLLHNMSKHYLAQRTFEVNT